MKISQARMKKAVDKFNEFGRGVMGNYQSRRPVTSMKQTGEYTYQDLINPVNFTTANLKGLLVSLNKRMSSHVSDPEIFTKTPVYFKHETPLGDMITFTVKDAYCMVRAAYLEQCNNSVIINARKELADINKELLSLRTRNEVKRDLNDRKSKLENILG